MKDYSQFSIDELCERFAIYDDERSLIDTYVSTRPDEEQFIFNSFKKRNAVGIGLEPSPFEGIKAEDIFMIKEREFIIYDQYNFEHYKYFIDELLKSYEGRPGPIKRVLSAELVKCQSRLSQLQEDALSIFKKADLDENFSSCEEVEKCINYISNLASIPPELLFKESLEPRLLGHKVVIRAAYYRYLQEAGYRPLFDDLDGYKKDLIRPIAEALGASPNSFNQQYDLVLRPKDRIENLKYKDLKGLLPLLEEYPDALQLALKDITQIEIKA